MAEKRDRVTLYPSMGPHLSTAKPRGTTGQVYFSSSITDELLHALQAAMTARSGWVEEAERVIARMDELRED